MPSKLTKEKAVSDSKAFANAWKLWIYKGHNPLHKLELCSHTVDGKELFSLGLLDYVTLEQLVFPSPLSHESREQAFATVGKALDTYL